jgi:hypothetical protein
MFSSEEAYNKHLPKFSSIPNQDIKTPKMARDDVIGESEELKITAHEDEEVLDRAGCPRKFIRTLDERIGAFAHASSVYENSEFTKTEAKKQWLEMEGPAHDLKWDIIHDFRHALRRNPDELKYVEKIAEGQGRRDLVLDFKDIAVLGKRNQGALEAIHFDTARLVEAESLHDRLSNLLSEANMSPEEVEDLKTLTWQAYTYLQEAVSEIRENGQYVFWKNPERLDLYKSDHFQRIGKIEKKKKEESETEPQTE